MKGFWERIVMNRLGKKMKEIGELDLSESKLDRDSFATGYSNGWVTGFYLVKKWLVVVVVLLVISVVCNLFLLG